MAAEPAEERTGEHPPQVVHVTPVQVNRAMTRIVLNRKLGIESPPQLYRLAAATGIDPNWWAVDQHRRWWRLWIRRPRSKAVDRALAEDGVRYVVDRPRA